MKSAANRLASVMTGLLASGMALSGPVVLAKTPASAAKPTGPAADYPMVLGSPFVVDGVTYTPVDTMNYDAVGYAVPDALVAAGHEAAITGAHRTLPLPCYVEVTSLESGHTILLRLERRGPMSGDGLIALSPGAMAQLGMTGPHDPVRVRRVNPPEAERALLRTGQQAAPRMDTPPGLLTALKRKLGVLPPVEPSPATLAAALAAQHSASAPAPVPQTPARPVAVRNTTPMPAPRPPKPSVPPKAPATTALATPKPAPAPKPKDEAPKAEARKEAGSERKSAPTRGYVVQVGAFSTRANAERAAGQVGAMSRKSARSSAFRRGPWAPRRRPRGRWRRPSGRAMPMPGCNAHPDGMGS
jgi:rare lipoprotein A